MAHSKRAAWIRMGIPLVLVTCLSGSVPESSKTAALSLFIPVRFVSPSGEGLTTGSGSNPKFFNLQINGKPVPVSSVHRRHKSLARATELGRNFILAFHVDEFSPQIEATLEMFLSEVVTTRDTITLLSPTNIYRVPVSADKGRMMTAISSHLEKDLHQFRRDKAQMESTLRTTANRISLHFRRYYWSAVHHEYLKTSFAEFVDILESYKTNYLAPNHILWEKSAAIAANRPGSTWMLMFKRPRRSAAINRWVKILKSQEGPALMVLSKIIGEFRDRRPFSIEFPISDYSAVLTERDITLHTLVVSEEKTTEDAVENDFQRLSMLSGGSLMHLDEPGAAVESLRAHGEIYTVLEAQCGEGTKPKTIRIHCADGSAIRYKQLFTGGELAALKEQQSGVVFQDIHMIKNRLTIEIGSYKRTGDGTGFVTIQIELIHSGQPGSPPIFSSKKTLRAHGKTLAITLPVPAVPEGEWVAEITAYDLVANRSTRATYHPLAHSRAGFFPPGIPIR